MNRVLFGWSFFPLEKWIREGKEVLTKDELKKRLLPLWGGHFRDHPRSLAAAASMLWNYLFEMKKGDIAIVPTYRQFAIGEFTGEIGRELDDFSQDEDIANWRGVKWLTGPINRSELTAAFRSSLKYRSHPPPRYAGGELKRGARFFIALRCNLNSVYPPDGGLTDRNVCPTR